MENDQEIPKNKAGRPCEYTQERAEKICALIAEGISVRTICKMDGMPETGTFYRWLRVYPEFMQQYACAKEDQADALAEEMLDIADDGTNDWMELNDKKGECIGYQVNGEHVQRSRLRVETRKWLLAKQKPKKFGDGLTVNQQQLDRDGKPTDPVRSDDVLAQALKAVIVATPKPDDQA